MQEKERVRERERKKKEKAREREGERKEKAHLRGVGVLSVAPPSRRRLGINMI